MGKIILKRPLENFIMGQNTIKILENSMMEDNDAKKIRYVYYIGI